MLKLQDVVKYTVDVRETEPYPDGCIKTGTLTLDGREYPIRDGVPRLVPNQGYTSNFTACKWNTFKKTQLDSALGLPLTFNRFWNNTKWKPRELYGKNVLEAGSGAGRFTEVLLEAGVKLCSIDLSVGGGRQLVQQPHQGRFDPDAGQHL